MVTPVLGWQQIERIVALHDLGGYAVGGEVCHRAGDGLTAAAFCSRYRGGNGSGKLGPMTGPLEIYPYVHDVIRREEKVHAAN